MQFTGERYVPEIGGQIAYEHVHRYAITKQFCSGKRVLDIASGEGYGAALLARTAKHVTGVDADERAIEHSRQAYYAANVRFLVGSVTDIPLADSTIDVVASFETIEHVEEHERMLDEIRRVLAPGGVLVISSPNKLVYSDEPQYVNPFHVRELYFAQFRDLLASRFRHVSLYGQRLTATSLVHPLAGDASTTAGWFNGRLDRLSEGLPTLDEPVYFVAVCGDEPPAFEVASAYVDPDDDVLRHWRLELGELRAMAARVLPGAAPQAALPPGPPGAEDAQHAFPAPGEERVEAQRRVAELEAAARLAAVERNALIVAHAASIEAMRSEHERSTNETVAKSEAALAALRTEHARTLEAGRTWHEGEVRRIHAEREATLNGIRANYDAELLALRAQHEAALALRADQEREGAESERARLRAEAIALAAELEAVRLEIAALRSDAVAHGAELAALRAADDERTATHAEAARLHEAELSAVRTRLAAAVSELARERAQVARSAAEALAVARREHDDLERALRAELATLSAALDEAARDSALLREVLSSNSWRLTSPLRQAMKLVRG
jgi:SAM-dependent methyltransferase